MTNCKELLNFVGDGTGCVAASTKSTLYSGDNSAHIVRLTMPASSGINTGENPEARFLRPDGTTIVWQANPCTVTDDDAVIETELPSGCYAVPGRCIFSYMVKSADGSKKTVLACVMNVE